MFLLLFCIPVMTAGLCFALKMASGPYWHYYDPSYSYFMNGLNIATGKHTFFFYHPGTPLQLLCSFVMWVLNIGRTTPEMVSRVLAAPEFYLSVVHAVMVGFYLFSSLMFVFYVYRKTEDFWAACVTQLPGLFALSIIAIAIPVGANVAPDLLLIGIINLFSLSLFQLLFAESSRRELRQVLWLGFLCGLGISTKYSFLPLALVPLIILHRRRKILFLLVSLGSFIVWTMPLWYAYSGLWGAIQLNLCYAVDGVPSVGIFHFRNWILTLGRIVQDYWFFILLSFGTLIWSFVRPVADAPIRYLSLLRAVVFGVLFQFIILVRYYSPPYAVPGVCLSGLVLLMIFLIYKPQRFRFMSMVILAVFMFCTVRVVFVCVEKSRILRQAEIFEKNLRSRYPGHWIIPAYSAPAPIGTYALSYGGDNSGNQMVESLSRQYPLLTIYDNVEHKIWNHQSRWLADDLMQKVPGIIFVGGKGMDFRTHSPHKAHLVEEQGPFCAYLLTESTEKQANILFVNAQAFLAQGQYIQAAVLATKSLELGFRIRAEAEAIINEARVSLLGK